MSHSEKTEKEKAAAKWILSVLELNVDELERSINKIDGQAKALKKLGHDDQAERLTNQANLLREKEQGAKQGTNEEKLFAHAELREQAQGVVPGLLEKSGNARSLKAIDLWLVKCQTEIGNLAKSEDLESRRKELQKQRDNANGKQAPELEELERKCRALLNDVLDQAYKGSQKVEKRNEVLSGAIKDLYGIDVTIQGKRTDGKKTTDYTAKADLAKIYEVLSLLPPEHIATSSLKKLEIKPIASNRAEYVKGSKAMVIDSIKIAKTPNYEFEIDGKPYKVKTLSMATLHEVGHAIDDKVGLMSGNAITDASYGGWQVMEYGGYTAVAKAYVKTITQLDEEGKKAMTPLLANALQGEIPTPEKPPYDCKNIPERIWKAAVPYMKDCAAWKSIGKPWTKPRALGDTVYHFTYDSWYGYVESARAPTKVSEYQWRSPVEWFAELYAATWLAKSKPPSAVNAKVAQYLYQG